MQESIQPPSPSHDQIALLAYQLWEKNGRPAGQDFEFWLQAEQSLCASIKPPAAAASQPSRNDPAPRSKAPVEKLPGKKAKRTAAKPFKGGGGPF